MKRNFYKKSITLLVLIAGFFFQGAVAQTLYASKASGLWSDVNTWETFASGVLGAQGTGSTPASAPSGTHRIYIRSGHTVDMSGANRACMSLYIDVNGSLINSDGTDRRLQMGTTNASYPYPISDSIHVMGNLGGTTSTTGAIYVETVVNVGTLKFLGNGTIAMRRMRFPGGAGSAAGGALNVIIDNNITLTQSANYVISAVYNPALTDNYTITINPGKTVTTTAADGFFHNSQNSATYGKYTYNIKGTLDLSANTQALNNVSANITVPAPAASAITVNVDGGVLKTGNVFKADTATLSTLVSAGVLKFNVINGGVVDASPASKVQLGKSSNGSGGYNDLFFGLDATGSVKQTVGAALVKYPVGLNGGTASNNVSIYNAGTSDVHTVKLKNTFDQTPPPNTLMRQWDISEAVAGGSADTLRFSWTTADEAGSGLSHSGAIFVIHWNGTGWDYNQASVTGTGTEADPWVAKAYEYTSFSPFGITSTGPVPVRFVNVSAVLKNSGVQLEFTNSTESGVNSYVIERSANGIDFVAVGTLSPRSNNGNSAAYSFYDASPVNGSNFYRIVATEISGSGRYSTIVKINTSKTVAGISIYPNPVKGKKLNMQMENLEKGLYTVTIFNRAGQQVFNSRINHNGGASTQTIDLPRSLDAGMYNIQISNNENRFSKNIIVE